MLFPEQLSGTNAGIVYGTAIDDRIRTSKVHILKHAQRGLLSTVCPDRANAVAVCNNNFAGIQFPFELSLYAVQCTGFRSKYDTAVFPPSHTERTEAIGVSGSDQLLRGHNDQGISTFQVIHGVFHSFFNRRTLQSLFRHRIGDHFSIVGGVKNRTTQFILSPQLMCIDQITVMGNRHGTFYMADHNGLCIGTARLSGCGIPHMSDRNVPLSEFFDLTAVKYLRHQSQILMMRENATIIYHDPAAFLPSVLKCIQCNICHRRNVCGVR